MKLGKGKSERVDPPVRSISFQLPIPPSVNQLYVKRRGGQLSLTPAAAAYRRDVKKVISEKAALLGGVVQNSDCLGHQIYGVDIKIYMKGLENPKWFDGKRFTRGENKGKLKVKLRYKRVDADNRIKFLQDWVTKCVGLADDAVVFKTCVSKIESDEEFALVTVAEIPREGHLPDRRDPEWLKQERGH